MPGPAATTDSPGAGAPTSASAVPGADRDDAGSGFERAEFERVPRGRRSLTDARLDEEGGDTPPTSVTRGDCTDGAMRFSGMRRAALSAALASPDLLLTATALANERTS